MAFRASLLENFAILRPVNSNFDFLQNCAIFSNHEPYYPSPQHPSTSQPPYVIDAGGYAIYDDAYYGSNQSAVGATSYYNPPQNVAPHHQMPEVTSPHTMHNVLNGGDKVTPVDITSMLRQIKAEVKGHDIVDGDDFLI